MFLTDLCFWEQKPGHPAGTFCFLLNSNPLVKQGYTETRAGKGKQKIQKGRDSMSWYFKIVPRHTIWWEHIWTRVPVTRLMSEVPMPQAELTHGWILLCWPRPGAWTEQDRSLASSLGAIHDVKRAQSYTWVKRDVHQKRYVLRCDAERGQPGPGQKAGSGNSA